MRIVVVVFDGVQSLDVTGPVEVFAHAAREKGGVAYRVELVSVRGGRIRTSSGLVLDTQKLGRSCDTVIVAGGSEAGVSAAANNRTLLAWLQKHRGRIASVCSGAFILAAAQLLDGRAATTHWSAAGRFAATFPAVRVEANAIYLQDGRVWTSAGITTGIDMALAMVERDCGAVVADRVAAQLVLHSRRIGGQSQFSEALVAQSQHNDPLSAVIVWANGHLRELDVDTFAKKAGVSVRTCHRLCLRVMRTTPAKIIEGLRIDRARQLLKTTDLGLKEVAALCGYRDAAQLTRAFQRRLGTAPHLYRRQQGSKRRQGPFLRTEKR